jgi:hypothetical protein
VKTSAGGHSLYLITSSDGGGGVVPTSNLQMLPEGGATTTILVPLSYPPPKALAADASAVYYVENQLGQRVMKIVNGALPPVLVAGDRPFTKISGLTVDADCIYFWAESSSVAEKTGPTGISNTTGGAIWVYPKSPN